MLAAASTSASIAGKSNPSIYGNMHTEQISKDGSCTADLLNNELFPTGGVDRGRRAVSGSNLLSHLRIGRARIECNHPTWARRDTHLNRIPGPDVIVPRRTGETSDPRQLIRGYTDILRRGSTVGKGLPEMSLAPEQHFLERHPLELAREGLDFQLHVVDRKAVVGARRAYRRPGESHFHLCRIGWNCASADAAE